MLEDLELLGVNPSHAYIAYACSLSNINPLDTNSTNENQKS